MLYPYYHNVAPLGLNDSLPFFYHNIALNRAFFVSNNYFSHINLTVQAFLFKNPEHQTPNKKTPFQYSNIPPFHYSGTFPPPFSPASGGLILPSKRSPPQTFPWITLQAKGLPTSLRNHLQNLQTSNPQNTQQKSPLFKHRLRNHFPLVVLSSPKLSHW